MATPTQDRYVRVNGAWPRPIPSLTPQEALSAAKRLYRIAMGRPFKGAMQITSGNRHTWIRQGVFYVNPENGWHDLVHDISHYAHWRLHPDKSGHDFRHAYLEKQLVETVVTKGWLEGKLKRTPKEKPPVQEVRYQRILDRIKAWRTKQKRAANALAKLEKQKKDYEKRIEEGGYRRRASEPGLCAI